MIKANADRGRTHLDNFANFALAGMRDDPERPRLPHEVAAYIEESFSIRVPAHAVDALLKRLARQKWLKKDHGQYTVSPDKVAELPNLQGEQQKYLREQAALVARLVRFAEERHGITLNPDHAQDALSRYIEQETVPLVATAVKGRPYEANKELSDGDDYVIAEFVVDAVSSDPAAYEWIVDHAKGAILASAVHLPNLQQVDRRFNRTTLYFDAPLLLQLVGLEGPEAEDAVKEVVRLAALYGADIACFEHSVHEAEGVILFNVEARKKGNRVPSRPNGVEAYAIRAQMDASDLELKFEQFKSDLAARGVQVIERPDHLTDKEIRELDLHDALEAAVGGYRTYETLLKDVDSLLAVHFLRNGTAPNCIEDCRAVLVTDNSAVAQVGANFFRDEGHAWPVATHIRDLATILYLKAPQQAAQLPALRLAADAFAALEPGVAVWAKWLDLVDRQADRGAVSVTDVALLCHAQESRRALMDFTFGRPDRVTSATVHEVLAVAKAQVASAAYADARNSMAAAEQAASRAEGAEMARDQLEARLAGLEKELERQRGEQECRERDQQALLARITEQANARAKRLVLGCIVGVAVLTTAWGVVSLTAWGRGGTAPDIVLSGVFGAGAMVLIATNLQVFFGGDVRQWLAPVQRRLACALDRRQRRRLGLPVAGDEASPGSSPR